MKEINYPGSSCSLGWLVISCHWRSKCSQVQQRKWLSWCGGQGSRDCLSELPFFQFLKFTKSRALAQAELRLQENLGSMKWKPQGSCHWPGVFRGKVCACYQPTVPPAEPRNWAHRAPMSHFTDQVCVIPRCLSLCWVRTPLYQCEPVFLRYSSSQGPKPFLLILIPSKSAELFEV